MGEKIEEGRLSVENAEELAEWITGTFEGRDLSKLESEDYEKVMGEIEKEAEKEGVSVEVLLGALRNIGIVFSTKNKYGL